MSITIAEVLQEAAETHHVVYKVVDGVDADWASWYADWLIHLSPLPGLLRVTPVRSELVYLLVRLDKEYTVAGSDQPWQEYYATRLATHFTPNGAVS